MEGPALLDALVELARELGVEVRGMPRSPGPEGNRGARSGACRIGGRTWLLLAAGDPLEDRIQAAVDALCRFVPSDALEGRYLPPAVRERLERDRAGPGPPR